jgi:uncharacterized protein YndB with AHSA1/START domain
MLGSMVVTLDCVIEAPPALVFEIYTDPDRFPEGQPAVRGLIEAELDGLKQAAERHAS